VRAAGPQILVAVGLVGMLAVAASTSAALSSALGQVPDSVPPQRQQLLRGEIIAVGTTQDQARGPLAILATSTPQPGGSPIPPGAATSWASLPLPPQAHVSGMNSYPQTLGLDCESRSAVDWAAFWGKNINELEFFQRLPRSDDPQTGFVGDPSGWWGQVPPHAYGVYAGPVAALLRAYGVPAQAGVGLSLDDLRREIAAGRPVILWVAGHVGSGTPEPYTASDGVTSVVTPYEHTVLLIGYNPTSVLIFDEGVSYRRSLADLRISWSALGDMAIVRPQPVN